MSLENYGLPANGVYAILKGKSVEYLYHANTVATATTFIKNRALLSRHYVEKNGLFQTPQKSDPEDKKFDVWDHVFLDGADLHSKYSRANKYGPVLFKMKLDLLNSPLFEKTYVTKINPWYWRDSMSFADKYYSTLDNIKQDYLTGKKLDSNIMFTIRSPQGSINLGKFLHSIEIDKPQFLVKLLSGETKKIGDYAEETLRDTLRANGLGHIPISIRHNNKISFCACHLEYPSLRQEELKKRFKKK